MIQANPCHVQGPAWNPVLHMSLSAAPIGLCFSGDGSEEQENQNPEIFGLSSENSSWGWGSCREAERNDRLRERGRGSGMTQSPVPGSSHAHTPHMALPEGKVLPLGTNWKSSHWPGSWYKGRKGSSGNGACSLSTRRSRSMQHLRDSRVCSPRQNSGLSTSTTWAEHATVSCPS